MGLQSLLYFAFLPAVAAVYLLLPQRLQNPFLLAASALFYIKNLPATGSLAYRLLPLVLCVAVGALVYGLGRAIGRAQGKHRGQLVRAGVVALLAVLALFKYYNLSFLPSLFQVGLLAHLPFPLGISFFTFAAIGYLVDVGRGEVEAETDPIAMGVFLFFFATVTSGPICRAGQLLPQLKQPHRFEETRTVNAMRLFALGLFKKVAVADVLALVADQVFAAPHSFGGAMVCLAVVMYTLQLYFDFGGYSDMARASGLALGISLPENFKTPFFATNFSGFWNRWHISLSSWLQDYIFTTLVWADAEKLPLIGKKVQRLPALFCVFCVFFISGFWHGNTLPFVVWGLLQAIYRVGEELCHRRFGKPKKRAPARQQWAKRLGVFVLWCFSMVFFRAGSGPDTRTVGDAFAILAGFGHSWAPGRFAAEYRQAVYSGFYSNPLMAVGYTAFVLFGLALMLALDAQRFFRLKDKPAETVLAAQKPAIKWLLYFALVLGILVGLIMQNGGFGGGASFAYANF